MTDKQDEPITVSYADIISFKGLALAWGIKKCGFGQTYMRFDPDSGKLIVDSEYMGRRYVKAILEKLIDDAVFSDFEELKCEDRVLSIDELNAAHICGDDANHTIDFPEPVEVEKELMLRSVSSANSTCIKVVLSEIGLAEHLKMGHHTFCFHIAKNGFDPSWVKSAVESKYTVVQKEE